MENVFKYYDFSDFIEDKSGEFSGNEICCSELNEEHFLIFEKEATTYNLYVSKYQSKKDIGVNPPIILEPLIKAYDKSIPEHRIVLRKYLY